MSCQVIFRSNSGSRTFEGKGHASQTVSTNLENEIMEEILISRLYTGAYSAARIEIEDSSSQRSNITKLLNIPLQVEFIILNNDHVHFRFHIKEQDRAPNIV